MIDQTRRLICPFCNGTAGAIVERITAASMPNATMIGDLVSTRAGEQRLICENGEHRLITETLWARA